MQRLNPGGHVASVASLRLVVLESHPQVSARERDPREQGKRSQLNPGIQNDHG